MARPTKPLISKDACAKAALEIIDAEGLDALSLERLAKEIGVRAPSLYHHFADKAAILARGGRLLALEVPGAAEQAPPQCRPAAAAVLPEAVHALRLRAGLPGARPGGGAPRAPHPDPRRCRQA